MDIQIKKGLLDACVLYALKNGESYGYKIINDLKDIIDISESTLYPILKRLESGGALKTYSREFSGRLRRYYTLTSEGERRLKECRRDFEEVIAIYKKIFGERS